MAAATEGRGADAVIECAGRRDTFQAAWRLARPNGTVALVAMYEENQTLPLPAMYGKNLVFKTGGVDASRGPELVSLLAQGKLRTDFLITHRGPLSEILEGYRVFESHEGHCLKVGGHAGITRAAHSKGDGAGTLRPAPFLFLELLHNDIPPGDVFPFKAARQLRRSHQLRPVGLPRPEGQTAGQLRRGEPLPQGTHVQIVFPLGQPPPVGASSRGTW